MNKRGNRKQQNIKDERVKLKLKTMVAKTQQLQQDRKQEIQELTITQAKLESLLQSASTLDIHTLRNEIKNISAGYKNKRKQHNKIHKEQRNKQKFKHKHRKDNEHNYKVKHKIKNRTESLPHSKENIGSSNMLYIFIHGQQMIEYGMKQQYNHQTITDLCSLINKHLLMKKAELNLDYDITIYIWIDGNGINHKNGNIHIEFSGNERVITDIVDKKLISNNFENLLFVTNAHGKKK
eukprot:21232_1